MIDVDAITKKYTETVLADSLKARVEEVALYQINVDNYAMAVEVAKERGLNEYSAELGDRLKNEKAQLERAKVILDVVLKRVKDEQSLR